MSEFSSSVDSSFVLVGTDQSQVFPPFRPPTVTSDATLPSSISTLTSPIDSNMSSVGALEVPNAPLPLRLIAHIHFSQYITFRPTLSMWWDLLHPIPTIGP